MSDEIARGARSNPLRDAPAPGGIAVFPVRGSISAKKAQALFVDGMRIVMVEWFGRGRVEGKICERERIAGILGHRAALRRRDLAHRLALTTDKTIEEAVADLEAAPRDHE